MISNEYSVKLCMEHEVKRGNKIVKKELIIALRGEIYFMKFIINPEEDDVELRDNLLDFNIDDVPLLGEEGLPPFVCKIGKSSRNKKRAIENLNFFYQDIGTSSLAGGHLTQEKAAKEAIAIRMSRKFALLEEERPIIKTMAYNDKYKKILDEVWKDKVELDDTGSDINTMPFRIYVQLGRDDMKKVDRGITMINHTQEEAMGILTNVLCQVGVTTFIAKFLILDIPIDRDLPIVVVVDSCVRLEPYVWKKAVSFLDSLPVPLKQVNWKPDYKGSYTKEEEATGQWRTEIRLKEQTIMRQGHQDPNAQDMKPWKKYYFHKFTTSFYYGKDVAEMQSLGWGAYNPPGKGGREKERERERKKERERDRRRERGRGGESERERESQSESERARARARERERARARG
ncbi:hypothetical protein Tco_1364182, partial [Tanacetum coccineum]